MPMSLSVVSPNGSIIMVEKTLGIVGGERPRNVGRIADHVGTYPQALFAW